MYYITRHIEHGCVMSKYDALGDYLKNQRSDRVPMSFADIERITRAKLPPSSRYRAWWSNNDFNSVMTRVWRNAGFESEQVDMVGRKLVFRRVRPPQAPAGRRTGHKIHPAFGALKGMVRVMPGTDLTRPADPGWGRLAGKAK